MDPTSAWREIYDSNRSTKKRRRGYWLVRAIMTVDMADHQGSSSTFFTPAFSIPHALPFLPNTATHLTLMTVGLSLPFSRTLINGLTWTLYTTTTDDLGFQRPSLVLKTANQGPGFICILKTIPTPVERRCWVSLNGCAKVCSTRGP